MDPSHEINRLLRLLQSIDFDVGFPDFSPMFLLGNMIKYMTVMVKVTCLV